MMLFKALGNLHLITWANTLEASQVVFALADTPTLAYVCCHTWKYRFWRFYCLHFLTPLLCWWDTEMISRDSQCMDNTEIIWLDKTSEHSIIFSYQFLSIWDFLPLIVKFNFVYHLRVKGQMFWFDWKITSKQPWLFDWIGAYCHLMNTTTNSFKLALQSQKSGTLTNWPNIHLFLFGDLFHWKL